MVSLFFGMGVIQVIFVLQNWTHGMSGRSAYRRCSPISSPSCPTTISSCFLRSSVSLRCTDSSSPGSAPALKAVDQSYMVASSVGINEPATGACPCRGLFFVGLAGAAYAHYSEVLSYTSFNLMATLWLFMYVLIGA